MRVIITGGSGLIGSALTKDLTQDGYEVIVLSRNPERLRELPQGAQAQGWDGESAQGWGHLADGAEAIVNLAGESIAGEHFFPARWTAERKQRILQSRLKAGRAVVEAVQAAKHKPKVVIQSSAIGYYGSRGNEMLNEGSLPGEDFVARVCLEWEASTKAVEAEGVRRAVIRTGVVLSLEGGAFTRLLLPFKLFAGGPMGDGHQYLSWVHVADEIGAIRFLIDNPQAQGAFNLTAPHPVTNREFAKLIGKQMRRPSFLPVPGFVMRAAFGEVSEVVLEGQRVMPKRLEELGYNFEYTRAEAALHELLA